MLTSFETFIFFLLIPRWVVGTERRNKRRWPRCGHGRRSWGGIASVIAIAIVNANTNPDGGADRASGECSGPGSYYYATSTARDSAEPRYNKSATQRSDCPTCN